MQIVVKRLLAIDSNRTYLSSNSWRIYFEIHYNVSCIQPFLTPLIHLYFWKEFVYFDDGGWCSGAYNSLGIKHIPHLLFEKSIIQRTLKCIKNRAGRLYDYFLFIIHM